MSLAEWGAAVVVARVQHFEHSVGHQGLESAAVRLAELRRDVLGEMVITGGSALSSDSMSVIAWFEDAEAGMAMALYAGQQHFSVGIDHGPLMVDGDQAYGVTYARALSLASTGRPGEVACSNELLQAVPLPDGVGVFRAPEAREALVGHATHLLRDYR